METVPKDENATLELPCEQNISSMAATTEVTIAAENTEILPTKSSTPTPFISSSPMEAESIVPEIILETNGFNNSTQLEPSMMTSLAVPSPISTMTQLNRKLANRTPSPKIHKADSLGRKSPSGSNANAMKQRGSPRTVSLTNRSQQRRSPNLIQNLMTKKPSGKQSTSSDDVFLFQSVNFDNSMSVKDDAADSNSIIKLSSESQKEIQKEILLQKEEYRISRAAEMHEESSTLSSPSESTEKENYMSVKSDISEERAKAKLIKKLMSLGSIQDMIRTLQDIERDGLNQKLCREVSVFPEISKARRCKSGSESMLKSRMIDNADIESDLHLHVEDPEITKYTDVDVAYEKSLDKSFRPNISKMLDSPCNDAPASTFIPSSRVPTSPASPSTSNGVNRNSYATSTPSKIPKLKLDGILRPTSTKNEGISSVEGSDMMGTMSLHSSDSPSMNSKSLNSSVYPSGALILSPRTAFDDLSINSEDSSIRSSEKL